MSEQRQYFLESSAWVKRYKPEAGTDFINALFAGADELFYLSLAIVEVRKVFYRLWKYPHIGDQHLTDDEFHDLVAQFINDQQTMNRIEFTDEMMEKTAEILETVWLRSVFDLVQLSAYWTSP